MRRRIISQTGAGVSTWVPLDYNVVDFLIGLAAVVTGTVNYTIEHTYDDLFDAAVTPKAWPHGSANLVGATSSQEGNFVTPVSGVRINQASGSGSTVLTILQEGII